MQEENPQEDQPVRQPKQRSELENRLRHFAQRPDDSDEENSDDDDSTDSINYDENEIAIQRALAEEERRARELSNYELQVAAAATRDILLGLANRIRPDFNNQPPSIPDLPVAKLNIRERLKEFMKNGSTVPLFKNAADALINDPLTVDNTDVSATSAVSKNLSNPIQSQSRNEAPQVVSLSEAHRERNSALLLNALDRHADPAMILELMILINNNQQGFARNNRLIFELLKLAVARMVKMRNLIDNEQVEIIEKLILIANQPTSRDIHDISKRFSQIRSLMPGKSKPNRDCFELLISKLKNIIQKANPNIQFLREVYFFRDLSSLRSTNKDEYEDDSISTILQAMTVCVVRSLDQFIPHLNCKSFGYALNSLHQLIYLNGSNPQICQSLLDTREAAFQHERRFSINTVPESASARALTELIPLLNDEHHTQVSNELLGALLTRTANESSMAGLALTRLITTGNDLQFAFNYKLVIALFRQSWKSADPLMQNSIREYLNTLNHPIITDAVYPMLNHNIQQWFERAMVLCTEIKNKTEDPTYPLQCKIENCVIILMECKRSYNRRQNKAGFDYFYQFLERYAPACVSKDFAIENHIVDEKGSHINVDSKQKSNPTLLLHQAIEEANLNRKLHLFNGAIDSMIQLCLIEQRLNLQELKVNIDSIMDVLRNEPADIQKFIAISLIQAVSAKLTTERYSASKQNCVYTGPTHAVKLMKFLKNTHRFPLGLVLQDSENNNCLKIDIKKIDTLWAACVKEVKSTEKMGWKASIYNTREDNTDITYKFMNEMLEIFLKSIAQSSSVSSRI